MTIFWIIIFLIKKVKKLVETQKFCHHRLNHLFLHSVSYSQFFIWWILKKLAFSFFVREFLKKNYWLPPLERTWKNKLNMFYIFHKIVPKDISSFSRKSEKLCNSRLFLGYRNGEFVYMRLGFYGYKYLSIHLKFVLQEQLCAYHDPHGAPYQLNFGHKIYFT